MLVLFLVFAVTACVKDDSNDHKESTTTAQTTTENTTSGTDTTAPEDTSDDTTTAPEDTTEPPATTAPDHKHTFNKKNTSTKFLAKEATCLSVAEYYYSCSCGTRGTKTFKHGGLGNHKFDQVNTDIKYVRAMATCTHGTLYYYSCVCGLRGNELFDMGDVLEHNYSIQDTSEKYLKAPATCTAPATYYYSCTCGQPGPATFTVGKASGHVFDQKRYDSKYFAADANCTTPVTYYWSCVCGEIGTATFTDGTTDATHSFDQKVTTPEYLKSEATKTKPAAYYYSCVCGEKGGQSFLHGTPLPFEKTIDLKKETVTIVIPAETDDVVKKAIDTMVAELKDKLGKKFTTLEFNGESTDPNAYEIIVGNTGRIESDNETGKLSETEYSVTATGNKIVIAGGSNDAVVRAIATFLNNIQYEEGIVNGEINIKNDTKNADLVAFANQKNGYVEVYDVSLGRFDSLALVYSIAPGNSNFKGIADIKYRRTEKYGDVVLAVYGSSKKGYAAMYEYPSGNLLWETTEPADNPHSIEYLPNGLVAVASSAGNAICLFDPADSDPNAPDHTIELADAHGVLWDEDNQVLWGIGRMNLIAYKIKYVDGKITVTVDRNLTAALPDDHAHDLAADFRDKNCLIITTASKVFVYNKVSKNFTELFEDVDGAVTNAVKGAGTLPNGNIYYVYPDGKATTGKDWNTTTLNYVIFDDGTYIQEAYVSPTGNFYKCRIFDWRYHV